MKKEEKTNEYKLVIDDSIYYFNDYPDFPNQTKKSKKIFQSLERIILKQKLIWYPSKFNITERVVQLDDQTREFFSFSGIRKLIDRDKSLFVDTNTFFKLKISFVDNITELKIIYYTINNDKGLIDCVSSDMMLDIIFIRYKVFQFTPRRVEVLTNRFNLNMNEIRQIPIIPVQWLNFDENGNLIDFPNFKMIEV